jgi:serine/threonine protein kinase
MGDEVPKVIGEYTIMRPVASGVMGTVYVAKTPDNAFHAIKVLDPSVAAELPWATRFAGEIKDEHVLDYKSVDITMGDRPYFVSEYLEVKPISRRRLVGKTSADILEIAATLAETLQLVHDNGVAHGNIKSSNILVRTAGGDVETMISDFGIAYIYDPDVFGKDKVRKTFPYMSPERIEQMLSQAKPADALPTPAMDIHSLGATLCEMLTGTLPYSDLDSPEEILKKKKDKGYIVVGTNNPVRRVDLERLNEVVAKSTAYEPGKRYGSMKVFAEALRSCISV